MKRCPHCGETKPASEFYINTARRDGLSPYCVPCDREVVAASYEKYRAGAIAALGGKCVRCGYDADVRALQIDHVHGDGKSERKLGRTMLRRIIEGTAPGRYQLLCANCNVIKRFEEKEHGNRVYVRTVPAERIERPNERWTPEQRERQGEKSKTLWQDPEHRAKESARRSAAMKARWAAGEIPNKPKAI